VQTIDQFIEKLISSTFGKKTEWHRFSESIDQMNKRIKTCIENRRVVTEGGSYNRKYDRILLSDPYNSFVAHYGDGWILLISAYQEQFEEKRYYVLAVQNSDESNVVEIAGPQEYQADLYRLSMAIERQVEKTDDLIGRFIDDPST
jgi:hypothetical protein